MKFNVLNSKENDVWKYVFTNDEIVLETVLYRYNSFVERTVICCSVQSGCPVGCSFCGTGKNFLRNISSDEIVNQIKTVLKDKDIEDINSKCGKFQIMFMSMGEPALNFENVEKAIRELNKLYPNAQLLISTVGIKDPKTTNKIIKLSKEIDKIGLQFSIHKSIDAERDILIPYSKKYNLKEIRDFGILWWKETGRSPYLNYCVDESNSREIDKENLMNLFSSVVFNFTFSVICESNESKIGNSRCNMDTIKKFEMAFLNKGYNTRIFNPAGQDDIGGGCGQLLETQKYFIDKGK